MNEAEFITAIDAQFPYDDPTRGKELAAQACSISPNTAFAVAEELARPGYGENPPVSERLEVLEALRSTIDHPLAAGVLDVAERMIGGEEMSVSGAVALMHEIAAYPGQYCALNIAYFSCDDVDGIADTLNDQIRDSWETVPTRAWSRRDEDHGRTTEDSGAQLSRQNVRPTNNC